MRPGQWWWSCYCPDVAVSNEGKSTAKKAESKGAVLDLFDSAFFQPNFNPFFLKDKNV